MAALIAGGACFIAAYIVHARAAHRHPVLDLSLFRLPTFRASVVGGFMFRIGIGALPFLLPLMLQLGFGMHAVPVRPDHLLGRARRAWG